MKRIVAGILIVIGFALLAFSVLGWIQFTQIASANGPEPVSHYPVAEIFIGEAFEQPAGDSAISPAQLASRISNRIYLTGGAGLLIFLLGVTLLIFLGAKSSQGQN